MRHLAKVCDYLAVWAEPSREYDKFTPVPSLAEASEEEDELLDKRPKKDRVKRRRRITP